MMRRAEVCKKKKTKSKKNRDLRSMRITVSDASNKFLEEEKPTTIGYELHINFLKE